jgi:hypothetical protein
VNDERKEQIKQIWEGVKANHKILDDCPGPHDFQRSEQRFSDYKCSKCGGKVGSSDYYWYAKGLQDGQIVEQQRAFLEWAAENPEENQ